MREKAKIELNEITEELILPELLLVISFAKAFLDRKNKVTKKKE